MDGLPPATLPDRSRLPGFRSPLLAGVLGWVVPGLGHVYAGRPGKGALMFLAIVPAFALGLWLTAFTCVNPRTYSLEFVAHAFLGLPTGLALHFTEGMRLEELPRWFEVGRLYAAVAGLLNVVAISDALGEVIRHNDEVRRLRLATWDEPAPLATPAPVPAPAPEAVVNGREAVAPSGDAPAPEPAALPEESDRLGDPS
jgi:hypothetical protein